MSVDLAGGSGPTYAVVDKTKKQKGKNGSFPKTSQKPGSAVAVHEKSRATSENPSTENMYSNTGMEFGVDDSAVYDSADHAPTYSQLDRTKVAIASRPEKPVPKEQPSSVSYDYVATTGTDKTKYPSKQKKHCKIVLICCLIALLIAFAFSIALIIALVVAFVQISHLQSDIAFLNKSSLPGTAANVANSSTTTNAVISDNTLVSNLTTLDSTFQEFMDSISTDFSDLQSIVYMNISEIRGQLGDFSLLEKRVFEIENEAVANFTRLDNEVNKRLEDISGNVTTQLGTFMDLIVANITETGRRTQQTIENLTAILADVANGYTFASCAAIRHLYPSGYYNVRSSNGSAVHVYCDMTRSCGNITGGWMRVAQLDMRNSSTQCPGDFSEQTNLDVRTCRLATTQATCSPVAYQTQDVVYSKVCGMIRGYQVRYPDGFNLRSGNTIRTASSTIDSNYVDGVSLTRGTSSRQHVWSFGAGGCPCSMNRPSFVGDDFSCDGVPFAPSAPCPDFCGIVLWDGEGCQSNNSPWFYRDLQQSTTDDLEMRVCRDEPRNDEDIEIEIVQIFVQ